MQRYPHGSVVIVLDCRDLGRSGAFWSEALGYTAEGEPGETYWELVDQRFGGPALLLQRTDDPKRSKNRVHLDLRTPDLTAEVERLRRLGAQVISTEPIHEDGWTWLVLADPDGNELCVLQPAAEPSA